jgi:DNA polymerase I-like protein with 3'-5' exonuclease and polymerase domains
MSDLDGLDLKPVDVELNITRIRTLEEVDNILIPWFHLNNEMGWDLETNVEKQFFTRKTRTIQFGNKKKQFFIDLLDFTGRNAALLAAVQGWYGKELENAPKLAALITKLTPFLCSDKWLKVGVNLGFEFTQMYWGFGIMPYGFYSCDLVERIIYTGIHSLEDYDFFSMENLMARYYGMRVDKALQTSFTLDGEITEDQVRYAVLDTRLPLAIRARQLYGYEENGKHIPGVIEDGLMKIVDIENAAIMPFEQLHIHGEKIDKDAWNKRTDEIAEKFTEVTGKLDEIFVPLYGSKLDVVSESVIEEATSKWKAIKDTKDPIRIKLKEYAVELRSKRTKFNKLANAAPGEALLNYGSHAQMLKALRGLPGLKTLKSTDDEYLSKFEGVPVIDIFRDYRELEKQLSTYGYAWAKEWTNRPCVEEGWISPYTHKLHSRYNQLAAETGRSSSDNPNGQNLPRDKKVRQCFIAEAGMVYITIDMSGAELRIIAELANAITWIEAFNKGEDLHSVGCEILFPKEWLEEKEEGCLYYATNDKGQARHEKCECKKHKARREITKAINFLLAYGGIAATLAARTGMSVEDAEEVMAQHASKFPDIHAYLTKSGRTALKLFKSLDMCGRRRRYRVPTKSSARDKIIKYWKNMIKLPEDVAKKNVEDWKIKNSITVINKKGETVTEYKVPDKETKFWLTHREPNEKEIQRALRSMLNGIERAGKNQPIQGTNITMAKIAMGALVDDDGLPFLFHTLPKYSATLVKFVHDELVLQCPEEHGKVVAELAADAIRRAAVYAGMKKVTMESEYKIAKFWSK